MQLRRVLFRCYYIFPLADIRAQHTDRLFTLQHMAERIDLLRRGGIIEERSNDGSHYKKGEHGHFAGSTPYASGGGSGSSGGSAIRLRINLFNKSDPLYLQAFSIDEEDGFEDICSHGSPDSIEVHIDGKKVQMNAEQFADYLKKQNKTGDFRLASCSTGKGDNSFAQQLSKIMQNKIKAPDDDVYYIPEDGVLRIGSEYRDMGKWRTFDKGVEVL